MFYGVMFLFLFAFVVICIVGAVKEYKIRTKYSGVFGRVAAYFSAFLLAPPIFLVSQTILLVQEGFSFGGFMNVLFSAIVLGAIGIVPIWLAHKNCPQELRKGLAFNMVLAGAGVAFKVSLRIGLFFLPFLAGGLWPAQVAVSEQTYEREQEYYDKDTGKTLQYNSDKSFVKVDGEFVRPHELDPDDYGKRDK